MTKEKGFIEKSNISNLIKNSDLNTKLATLATKAELQAKQNKIVKLQTRDLSYFLGKIFLVMIIFKILFINQQLTP